MSSEWLLLLGIGLVPAVWLVRARKRAASRTSGVTEYHCVTISSRRSACQAVIALKGKRFLPDEAPTFPLPECDAKHCRCRYVHFDDRRHDERRDSVVGLPDADYSGPNRRASRGRRRFDHH
jgi:hypothetical protein